MLVEGDFGNTRVNGTGRASWWRRLRSRPGAEDGSAFRRLALQLHYDLQGAGPRAVLLGEPGVSAGKGDVAVHLACALASELSKPILLIDASPSRPVTSEWLGIAPAPGFTDLLSPGGGSARDGGKRLEEGVYPTSQGNLFVLPAGQPLPLTPEPADLRAFLDCATKAYDFVVLAGGSVLNDSLTRALAPHAGCVLLTAVENETLTEQLDAAQSALALSKARKVGVVLTTAFGASL